MKKGIGLLLLLGCVLGLRAQGVKEERGEGRRDAKEVYEQVKALRMEERMKQADSIAMAYMARCPVVQLGDKDTYLLVGRYAFEDVYTNAFDYGLFIMKKMRWEREQKEGEEAKAALLYRLRWGGGEDEIDKRYEVVEMLGRNLDKEIERRCVPLHEEGKYRMPEYDSVKVGRLKQLLQKGEFIDDGSMRMKVAVYEDYVRGDWAGVLRKLSMACDLEMKGVGERYAMQVLSVLADEGVEREYLQAGIALLHRYADGKEEGSVGCYGVLGRLYTLCGDEENGKRYEQLGREADAEREERYGGFMNLFKNKQ